jgi:hypothetical protein
VVNACSIFLLNDDSVSVSVLGAKISMHHRNVYTRWSSICLRKIVPSIEPAIIRTLWKGYFMTLWDISHECWEECGNTSSACWNGARIIESILEFWTDEFDESFDTLSLRECDNHSRTWRYILSECVYLKRRDSRHITLMFLPCTDDTGGIIFLCDGEITPFKHSIRIRLQILTYTSLRSENTYVLLESFIDGTLQIS